MAAVYPAGPPPMMTTRAVSVSSPMTHPAYRWSAVHLYRIMLCTAVVLRYFGKVRPGTYGYGAKIWTALVNLPDRGLLFGGVGHIAAGAVDGRERRAERRAVAATARDWTADLRD